MPKAATEEATSGNCQLDVAAAGMEAGEGNRHDVASALNCALLSDCHRHAECLEKVSDMIERGPKRPDVA